MAQDSEVAKDLGWGPKWRLSGAHLAFLATFITPRLPNDHPKIEGFTWHQVLGQNPEIIVSRLRFDSCAIDVCTDAAAIGRKFNVKELREMLCSHDVQGFGKLRKQELIEKVIEHRLLLQCTEAGREIAQAYADDPESFLNEIWTESRMRSSLKWLLTALAEEIAIGTILGTLLLNAREKLLSSPELPPRPTPITPEPVPAPEPPTTPTPSSTKLDIEWCRVPAGYCWMGEDTDKQRKYLPAFSISKYPITNAQYAQFCRTGHATPSHWEGGRIPAGKETHPVVYVSWEDAVAYCKWASQVTGEQITLPSEEQWEKAARGVDGRKYPWGNKWRDNYCNTGETGNMGTTAVGKYSPRGDSPYGCADMAGNVWEWTGSWLDGTRQDRRVVRGGMWYTGQFDARAAFRLGAFPAGRSPYSGFRGVVRRTPSR